MACPAIARWVAYLLVSFQKRALLQLHVHGWQRSLLRSQAVAVAMSAMEATFWAKEQRSSRTAFDCCPMTMVADCIFDSGGPEVSDSRHSPLAFSLAILKACSVLHDLTLQMRIAIVAQNFLYR